MQLNFSLKKVSTSFIIVTLITIISSSFNSYASEEKPTSKKRLISQVEDTDEPEAKRLKLNQELKKEEGLKDAFYIFNVGQGNSQLAIYAEGLEEPFGVLYDCGTSAQTVSDKILKFQSANKKKKPFLVRKNLGSQPEELVLSGNTAISTAEAKDKETPPIEEKHSPHSGGSSPSSQGSLSNEAKIEKRTTSITTGIRAELQKIKNLFVILSHPDKDHINLLEESLPNTLNVLFILCGNFFMESESDDLKTDVGNLFSCIEKRKRTSSRETYVTLPYFWTSKFINPYSSLRYHAVESYVSSYSSLPLPQDIDRHIPEAYQGDFSAFLTRMIDVKRQEGLEDKTKESNSPFYTQYIEKPHLKDIYLWSMNHISDDINNHSAVISFRMPNLEKTFICTGDAGPEVFQKIQKKVIKKSLQQDDTSMELITPQEGMRHFIDAQLQGKINSAPYIILLMLPHHGAKGNFSLPMLDLFMPHILGISAGAGSMYNHPNTILIEGYQKEYKKAPHLLERQKKFWEQYKAKIMHYYVTFRDKNKPHPEDPTKTIKVQTARLQELEKEELPILATGIAGTIYVDKDSYYAQYISYFQYEERSYKIKFKKSAFEHDRSLGQLMEGAEIQGSSKVNLPDNIQKIKYSGVEFIRKKKHIFDKGIFLSPDAKQLLLPLGIKYSDGKKDKIVWKFYLGYQIIEEGESSNEKM
ncbi:MAG: hypothetical protein J0H12_04130 [Candidatus Paracaedimonas acanthamoebae]|uniref:Uncharacterized protein n=1 Tax=Candidatus Paracaedimonas acanthamoebae TaxID=244581 RepID=A0A8J7TUE8_9PROT|nr:hypothetical protein [Candidatus Paracaedimonas acanthamoebae]